MHWEGLFLSKSNIKLDLRQGEPGVGDDDGESCTQRRESYGGRNKDPKRAIKLRDLRKGLRKSGCGSCLGTSGLRKRNPKTGLLERKRSGVISGHVGAKGTIPR